MIQLIAPILFIGAVLYIAYPLLKEEKREPAPEDETTDREKLLNEKEDVIENLKDIEMDFRMQKDRDNWLDGFRKAGFEV